MHKTTTTKPAVQRLREHRAGETVVGLFLENRQMAKAVMTVRGKPF